jgi:hypothetical protein
MFPNFIYNVREAFDNVAHDVAAQANRFRNNNDGPASVVSAAANAFGFDPVVTNPPSGHNQQRVPPASAKAIRQLPTIRVAPEDLIDPNNRECCVCLDENKLGDRVTRLPCAHIFHTNCIVDWLLHHSCTCPICRYELPTDDPQFEAGRLERMKTRKPRFAMHELERMPASELLELYRRPVAGGMEKKELIQVLIDQELIDVIPSPEPVEYRLDGLKRMKIRELKHCMEDAGVFFRPEDVVEKADMITIFLNSGRLVILPPSPPPPMDTSQTAITTNPVEQAPPPETIAASTGISDDVMSSSGRGSVTGYPGNRPTVQTVTEHSDGDDDIDDDLNKDSHAPQVEVLFFQQRDSFYNKQRQDSSTTTRDVAWSNTFQSHPSQHVTSTAEVPPASSQIIPNPTSDDRSSSSVASIEKATCDDEPMPDYAEITSDHANTATSSAEPEVLQNRCSDINAHSLSLDLEQQDHWDPRGTFQHYTISNLQDLAKDAGIDLSSCFERREMVDLMVRAGIFGTNDPTALSPALFRSWTVAQLRIVASDAKIDLSSCRGRHEMIETILEVANTDRRYLRDYLRSLSPLARKTLSELRLIARELHIAISDCLEKDEIIERLISRSSCNTATHPIIGHVN